MMLPVPIFLCEAEKYPQIVWAPRSHAQAVCLSHRPQGSGRTEGQGNQKATDGSPRVDPPSLGRTTVLLWGCSELGAKWLTSPALSSPDTSGQGWGKTGRTGPASGEAGFTK